MANEHDRKESEHPPVSVSEFIGQLIRKMGCRRKVREEVKTELVAHFEDELSGCAKDERERKARQLIADFGDPKLLGVLVRRAKKRCRPLWQKVLFRGLQVSGIFVLYLLLCSIPLFVGKPTLSVNYVEWLNDFVKNGRDEADNARPCYEKACESHVEMPMWLSENVSSWPTDFNDVDLKSLTDWLQDNQRAIESFREGSSRPGCWGGYRADATKLDKDLVANAMEILPKYRRLARTVRWQIRNEAGGGDVEAALNDSVALVRFGGHLQGHGLLIEQLVGIAIEALAHGEIFAILERFDVPADILKNTHRQLERQFGRQKPVVSLEAEKVFWYDGIQRGFTDNGRGNGRILAYGLRYVITHDVMDNLWKVVTFDLPDRKEMIGRIDEYFAGFADALAKTPWELHNEPSDKPQTSAQTGIAPLLLELVAPGYARVSAITWRMRTGRGALLAVLALLRYERAKGLFPADLDELIEAGYMKRMPRDAFSDEPLVYRRSGDSFILYSFGPNCRDDDGISGTGITGRSKQWADEGDTVFWPLLGHKFKSQ